jgi:hypothetical protein
MNANNTSVFYQRSSAFIGGKIVLLGFSSVPLGRWLAHPTDKGRRTPARIYSPMMW